MEKLSNTVCPVCCLYLREGITLKNHLQTHSKEKVIEALLKTDLIPTCASSSGSDWKSNSPNSSCASISGTSTDPTIDRNAVSDLASTSFVNSNNQNNKAVLFDNQILQHVNNTQFPLNVNNIVSQPSVGNMCNATLTYQSFVTNDGHVLLVPVYNMCSPPVMMPNNVVPTSVINACADVSSASATTSRSATSISHLTDNSGQILSIQQASPRTDDSSEKICVRPSSGDGHHVSDLPNFSASLKDGDGDQLEGIESTSGGEVVGQRVNIRISRKLSNVSITNRNIYELLADSEWRHDDDEAEVNEEVASILESSSSSANLNEENGNDADIGAYSHIADDRELDSGTSSEEEAEFGELKICEDEEEKLDEIENTNSISEIHSELTSPVLLKSMDLDDTNSMENESDIVLRCCSTNSEMEIDCIPNNSDSILVSPKEENSSSVSKSESDNTLPSNELPDNSSVPSHSNFGVFALCNKASLVKSAPVIENTSNTGLPVFPFFTQKYFSEKLREVDPCTESALIADKQIGKTEDFRVNVGSSSSSRISPFNIQTDESMPARGELSEQESLSSAENSVWGVQSEQVTSIAHYDMSHGSTDANIGVGFHSLITRMNMDGENGEGMEDIGAQDSESLVPSTFRNKMIREFHCFFCKKTFNTWKLRQMHITEEHAYEDSLTVETLFGKRLKFLREVDETVKEENTSTSADIEDTKVIPVPVLEESEDTIICRICNATFKTSLIFIAHLKEVHAIKKRSCVCPTCFVRFDRSEDFQQHILKVHPYECMTCGKKFFTRPGYMLHQKRHMKVKPYSCDVCDKSFVTKQKLTEHFNIHTGNNPIKCEYCDSQFKRYSNYQQHKKFLHMNGKRKLKDFICDCGEVFHSKTKLMWHQEIHDEKPKQCPFCVERFVHASSLTRHVRKCHYQSYINEWVNKKNTKNVPCPICNVAYLHTSLQTHMKIHEDVKPFSCGECSRSFRTKWNLQLHKWVHMSRSAKPYKCKICVKAYIHKTDYDAHLRSHNNNRPYSCNVCGRQFIRKYNCLRHVKEHVEPRAFKCDTCGKMFSRSYYLTEHQKVHSGLKPHICHFCGKASATKSNHNKHVKMHTMARETINSEN